MWPLMCTWLDLWRDTWCDFWCDLWTIDGQWRWEWCVRFFQTFEKVTIMFSYLIGFSDICANASAFQVVECINNVFTVFDNIVDRYRAFKVGTGGSIALNPLFIPTFWKLVAHSDQHVCLPSVHPFSVSGAELLNRWIFHVETCYMDQSNGELVSFADSGFFI